MLWKAPRPAAFLMPVPGVEAKPDRRDRCDNHPRWHHKHRGHDRHHSGLIFSFNFSPAPVVHTPVRRSVVVNRTWWQMCNWLC